MRKTKLSLVIVMLGVVLFPVLSANAAGTAPESIVDSERLEPLEPTILPKPPFRYYLSKLVDKVPATKKSAKLTFAKKTTNSLSFDQPYSDTAAFAAKEYAVPNPFQSVKGNLPEAIPIEYQGEMLVRAIKGKNNVFLIYGLNFGENRYLVVMDKSFTKFLYAFDFVNFAYSPKYVKADYDYVYQQIQWAEEENGILYISHSHRTYAKSSNGMNGYITAIRLSDNKMLWRSSSLVSNARNFELAGDVILSGYGFTAEKDFLYQIDKRTGKTLDKVALKDGPDYIVKQSNNVYVYGYSVLTQFQFKK